ncbi:MAG: hypothetical protein GC162_16950 [Planctomycetes bacterium]|nr:hypothetical protein [Planctomycetota bacterium]
MKRSIPYLCVLAALIGAAALWADEPRWPFTSIKAKSAAVRYEKTVKTADADHNRALDTARKEFIADLNEAMVDATKAGNLEEAIRIKDAKEQLLGAEKPAGAPATAPAAGTAADKTALTSRLVGSKWRQDDPNLTEWLLAENNVAVAASGRKGVWQAINNCTICVKFEQFYVMSVNDDMESGTGYSTQGKSWATHRMK